MKVVFVHRMHSTTKTLLNNGARIVLSFIFPTEFGNLCIPVYKFHVVLMQ